MPKRTYSSDQKSEMVRILADCGGNLSEAARVSGVPRKTIEYVARVTGVRESRLQPALAGTGGEQTVRRGTPDDRDRAIAGWRSARDLHLTELADPEKAKRASVKDNGVIAGIAQDKLNILSGGLTGRTATEIRVSLVAPDGRTFSSLREASLAVLEGDYIEHHPALAAAGAEAD